MYLEKELLSSKLSSKSFPRHGERLTNFSKLKFDLPMLIENMKHEPGWEKGELNSMILLKSPEKKIILTIMHEDTEVRSAQVNSSVTFQVIEGKLIFHIREESIILKNGESLTIYEKVKYKFDSMEESSFILTLIDHNGIEGQL